VPQLMHKNEQIEQEENLQKDEKKLQNGHKNHQIRP
jgi:hypothetical protein